MKHYQRYYLLVLLICFLALAAKQLGRSELVYYGGDESRHFMNGVFLKDFMVDRGWTSPFQYLQWYYLKYPALSVHQYPPLFYLLEAAVISLFGIQVQAIQLLIFTIIGISLYYWYQYVNSKSNPEVAFISGILFITSPIFLDNFSKIMLEGISLSMILLFLYTFDRWQRSQKRIHFALSLALLCAILGVAFKAYFLVFYVLLSLLVRRYSTASIRKQHLILAGGFGGMFLLFFAFGTFAQATRIPLFYRTLQGVNMISLYRLHRVFTLDKLNPFARFQLAQIFGFGLILLGAIGAGYATRNHHWHKLRSDLLYAANFLCMFTLCITHFESGRFNIFLLPFFSLMAGYGLYFLLNSLLQHRVLYLCLILGILTLYFGKGMAYQPSYLQGYEEAAQQMIALNTTHAPILCDSYLDGNFIAFMRKYDPQKQQIIFRGDKILFASNIYYHRIKKTYADTEQDVYRLLDFYGIRYVVVDGLFPEIKQKALLRNILQDQEKFHHIQTFQVATNVADFKNASLEVYEYVDYKTNYDLPIDIYIPVMNTTFSFTVNQLKARSHEEKPAGL